MKVYYIYPQGSRSKAAKTSRRWKAYWYVIGLCWRETWLMFAYRRFPRWICVETSDYNPYRIT